MAIKRSSDSPETPKQPRKKNTPKPSTYEVTLLSPQANNEETENSEAKIRPQKLVDYIGQKKLKGILNMAITAAKSRAEPLDHLLLYGPPGLGKTTMSLILAAEMGVDCKITSAPALERPRDITGLLVGLKPGDIIFIDEIHRLNRMTEELLYPAMEDFRLDVTIGKGQTAKTRSIPLPPFTLVGATTKAGALSSPLRDRFGMIQRLRFYELDELTLIVKRTAEILNAAITESGAIEIARRSRGTPRIANRLLRRVRDYVQVEKVETITEELAATAMNLFDVDAQGLDWTDRLVLNTIIQQFHGGPVGLEAIAAATGEDRKTIEEVYEPYLLQNGYLSRTHRGRTVTAKTYRHLGYQPQKPEAQQTELL
jgi:holliday junction DNA helicase RuvB